MSGINEWPEIVDFTDGIGDVSEVWRTDLFNLTGDNFNIEAVCPDYLPESQCWATWRRDEQGRAIVSGYDPEEDERNHWLCHCGYFTTDGYCHCVQCGGEAPWGCDCGARDEDYDEEVDFGFEFDPYEDNDDPQGHWLPGDLLEAGGWE